MSLYASSSPPAALSGTTFTIAGWFKVVNTAGSTNPILTINLSTSRVAKLYYRPSPVGFDWELDDGTNTFTANAGYGYSGWKYWSWSWSGWAYRRTYNDSGMSSGVSSAGLGSGKSLVSLEYDSAIVAIDELGVWDGWLTWLSDYDILYNSGNGATHDGPGIGDPVFDDCIAYWKLDEATGATRADTVGSWDLADTEGDVSAYSGILSNGALADGGSGGDAGGVALFGFHGFAK